MIHLANAQRVTDCSAVINKEKHLLQEVRGRCEHCTLIGRLEKRLQKTFHVCLGDSDPSERNADFSRELRRETL